jgi:hypothetical protein
MSSILGPATFRLIVGTYPRYQLRYARQKMSNKDSPTLREEERRAGQSAARARAITESSVRKGKSKDELQAEEESKADTVSRPGGFRNDPDDPTHPDEVRERFLRRLRELTYGRTNN